MKKTIALTLLILWAAACQAPADFTMSAPSVLRQALEVEGLENVSADAEIFQEGERLSTTTLETNDGLSFSGFVETPEGEFVVEVVFKGDVEGETLFLGRWVSDLVTVTQGSQSDARFNQPLDRIGRDSDGGDSDDDGFGNLDELLWGTDRNKADSDDDGTPDGQDCNPIDEVDASVVVGESALDCDGDGVRRVDVPFGEAGTDCNDRDADINPGADDDCQDAVDSDCNPQTCPSDDQVGPELSVVSPEENALVGCADAFELSAIDASDVLRATVVVEDSAANSLEFVMNEGENNRWTFNGLGAISNILDAGEQAILFRAEDTRGNLSSISQNVTFDLSIPEASLETGATIDSTLGEIDVAGDADVTRIDLVLVRQTMAVTFERVAVLDTIEGASGTFNVDLSAYADGTYGLIAEPQTGSGNVKTMADTANGTFASGISSTLICGGVRSITHQVTSIRGEGVSEAPTMQELLPLAIARAEADFSTGVLVQINGFGIDDEGRVALESESFLNRWQFSFYDVNQNRWFTVTWLSSAFGQPNPSIDANAGNVSATNAISLSAGDIPNSDAVAALMGSNCSPFQGGDNDSILYFHNDDGIDSIFGSSLTPPPQNESVTLGMSMSPLEETLQSGCR